MFGIDLEELIVILVIIIVLFGAKKLPELSKGIADSIRELRRGFTGDVSKKEDDDAGKDKKSS